MKKAILSIAAVVVLLVSVFCVSGSAVSSEVIDSVVIDISLNTDCTVDVKENWVVSYIGSADSFYRNIDIYNSGNGMDLVQKYGEISNVSVKIDGAEADESASGSNTFSFMKTADGKSYEIEIDCPSAQTVREYEISYSVSDSVKKNGSDAVFAYMVLGEAFRYTCNNVTVNVHFPGNTKDISISEGMTGEIQGNTVVFETKRVYENFSVEAKADKKTFESGDLVSYSAAAENMATVKNMVISALPYAVCVIAILIVIIFVLASDRILRFAAERRALKTMKAGAETKAKLPDGITACQAYKMLMPVSRVMPKNASKKVPVLFAMAILECLEKGYIIESDEKLIVGTPGDDVTAYIMSVLNFLKTFSDKKIGKYIIDDSFSENVRNECLSGYDVMTNYLATFYSLIPEVKLSLFRKNLNKEKYENAYLVKLIASQIKNKPTFSECAEKILSGAETSDPEIFAMLLSSSGIEKVFGKCETKSQKALGEAIIAMYEVFVKSK